MNVQLYIPNRARGRIAATARTVLSVGDAVKCHIKSSPTNMAVKNCVNIPLTSPSTSLSTDDDVDDDESGGTASTATDRPTCNNTQTHRHTDSETQQITISLSVNGRRSCLSCCSSKGVEQSAKRRYIGLVAVGVQQHAEHILVPPLIRNCSTLNDISLFFPFSIFLFFPLDSGPCDSFKLFRLL